MTARWEQIAQARQALAETLLTEQGLTPGKYLLSDDGYIMSREQFEEKLRQEGRIRSFPVRPSAPDQTVPSGPPSRPDNES